MSVGFQGDPRLEEPFVIGGLVHVSSDAHTVALSPDEARLYALKLIRAANKAEGEG